MSVVKNVVLVLLDSINKSHLPAYGAEGIATPNIDKFAEKALIFDNHFVGSLPCMPARREIFTGRKEFMWRPWGPLEPFDQRLPELLSNHGLQTGIVTDHFHYWEEAANGYIQGFASSSLVRGHEIDPWKPMVGENDVLPQWVQNVEKWRPGQGRRYYSNIKDFTNESEYFPAQVFSAANEWLDERSKTDRFFLQVESFDVHEPFHVPEPYASMYGPSRYDDEDPHFNIWPPYQHPTQQADYFEGASEDALNFVRSQYSGKLSMVDEWLGKFLEKLEHDGLLGSTMIVLTTDHGHDLGGRKVFGKSYPHWDSHANIPLMIWHPAHPGNGRRAKGLTSTVDLFATILEATGASEENPIHSRSLIPVLQDPEGHIRDELLYGSFGQGVCYTDGEWTVMKSPVPERESKLHSYSAINGRPLMSKFVLNPLESGSFIPNVPVPQWKTHLPILPLTHQNFLFNRRVDPGQNENVWESAHSQRDRLINQMISLIAEEGAPDEQFERLGLV